MTHAPDVPKLIVNEPGEAIRALRASGLRLSTARRLLIEALFAADGPVSAQHLIQTLSLEESSVYRNLEVLERHGLTRHVHLGHGPGLYALVGRDEGEYLYCEHCGKVTQLSPEQLDPVRDHIQEHFGHTARFTHFAIVGLCEGCAPEGPTGSR
ncbi:MAG TPA: transcriptional repressor [Solirubrobacteraceae bacterium]|jgi:Fur family ferric uptake transcriptional regulator